MNIVFREVCFLLIISDGRLKSANGADSKLSTWDIILTEFDNNFLPHVHMMVCRIDESTNWRHYKSTLSIYPRNNTKHVHHHVQFREKESVKLSRLSLSSVDVKFRLRVDFHLKVTTICSLETSVVCRSFVFSAIVTTFC